MMLSKFLKLGKAMGAALWTMLTWLVAIILIIAAGLLPVAFFLMFMPAFAAWICSLALLVFVALTVGWYNELDE